MKKPKPKPGGYWKLIHCRYVRRNGKIIYPKNRKCFRFWMWISDES